MKQERKKMYRKILMQMYYLRRQLRVLIKFNDRFTLEDIYDKIVCINAELKDRLRDWEKWKREKK